MGIASMELSEYLEPTRLCDFDKAPEIGDTAGRLTEKLVGRRQKFNSLYQFVKEFPYGLEDWDVKASETLHKGWGMCSGKTNLLVAMSRCSGIPTRYRIIRIKAEGTLWRWIARQDGDLAQQMGASPAEQDHITAEVYLDGWEIYDLSRDTPLEKGMKKLRIPRRRVLANDPDDKPRILLLASLDDWVQARQEARRFRKDRELIFAGMNKQFDSTD